MNQELTSRADEILQRTVETPDGVPGVVAMATDAIGNFYEGAAGLREVGKDTPMSTDSVMAMLSTTKAITGTAVMQLVEEGRISLDDPACRFVPELRQIRVLEGFDATGQPKTRAPKRDITVNDLMLHTAGFGYEDFSRDDMRYRNALEIPTVKSSTFESIRTVLLHDPGERWTYGVSIDWLGRVVEALRGKRLGEVMKERIFEPLGMVDIGFEMTDAMALRRATIHERASDGALTPRPRLMLPQPPPMDMGGQGLYAAVGEYMKFIRMLLNDGEGPHGRVLAAATVETMARNGLPSGMSGGNALTATPSLPNAQESPATVRKTWAYTFQVNEQDLATGRPAGSLMWSGFANLFYWIDRRTGVGGFWGTQVLPFQDAASYAGFVDFETAVYDSCRASAT